MKCAAHAVLTIALLSGCAVGPRYQAPPVAAPALRVGAPITRDSVRSFFDSLAVARAVQPTFTLLPELMVDVAWLDLLQDTALTNLVRLALQQNRNLTLARERIREFRANVSIARAPLFPTVTANVSAGRNQLAFGSFAPTATTALRLTADVAWELDVWGRTRRSWEAADADLAAEEAATRATELSLISDVALGYLQLLELDHEQAIAEQTLAARRATLTLSQHRYEQGVISELDVRQFEAQVAVPAVRLAQVNQARAIQEHALAALLGQPPIPIARGRSLADAARLIAVPDSLPATLLSRRPDVQQAERAYAAANARIGVAEAARYPALSIIGSYGTQARTAEDLLSSQTNVYQMQGGMSVQLFNGGRRASEATAARARAEEARARFDQSALTALREASDALVSIHGAHDQAAAQETQVTALRRALQLAELRYQTGISNYLEVLDAQRSLFDAELALAQAQLRQLSAAVLLYKALGGSWPMQLR